MEAVKFTITLNVDARLNTDGSVDFCYVPEWRELAKLIEQQHSAEDRKKRVADATRCRLDEDLVRVRGGQITYYKLKKLTKQYAILTHGPSAHETKWRLRGGYQVGSSGYGRQHIVDEDLTVLKERAPK